MSTKKESEFTTKQSSWAVQVVADQTGKSIFEIMTPEAFSEFLYVLFRYKNKSVFLGLATILKFSPDNTWRIERFWDKYVCERNPSAGVAELDLELLEKRPIGWESSNFREFLKKRLADFEKRGGQYSQENVQFGRPLLSSYLMHVESPYFAETLENENLSAKEWIEVLMDWKDAIDGIRSKSHYLKNKVLLGIINSGLEVQAKTISGISNMNKSYQSPTPELHKADPEFYHLCHGLKMLTYEIKVILDYNWHAFSHEECAEVAEILYSNEIAMRKDDLKICKKLGEEFFKYAFWSATTGTKQCPSSLIMGGALWGEKKKNETLL